MGPLTGDSCLLILGGVPGRYLLVVRDPRGETPVVGGCWGGALCTFLPPFNEGSTGRGCVDGWRVWELPIMPQW